MLQITFIIAAEEKTFADFQLTEIRNIKKTPQKNQNKQYIPTFTWKLGRYIWIHSEYVTSLPKALVYRRNNNKKNQKATNPHQKTQASNFE